MKRILTLGVLLSVLFSANAQMQAVFGYSTFYLADRQQPYVETYLQFDAWTMHFEQQTAGSYRAQAEVTIIVRQQDSVCFFKKYDLSSPAVPSLDRLDFSFIDVQRFSLANGIYDLEISLRDKGVAGEPSTVSEKLLISYDRRPSLSSLQLMASVRPTERENVLSRGGYDMEPYVSDFIPEQVKQLNFYYEIYNIDREVGQNALLTTAYVEQVETGKRFEESQVVNRRKSAATIPVLGSLDISNLPSGNYNLVCEVRNRDNQLMLYSKVPFFRSNPQVKGEHVSDFATTFVGRYTDEEELNLYLDALYPIASEREKVAARELVKQPGVEAKQAFLYQFWTARDAMAPEAEWLKYKERIDYVQEHFSYPRTRGIMTDRGRVYLQYGPPDFIRDEKNFAVVGATSAIMRNSNTLGEIGNTRATVSNTDEVVGVGQTFYLPYQLWRYNKLPDDDQNRVFLFWDEHRSGYYTLLNSNARGEVQEADWERRLSRQQLPEGATGEVGRQFNRGY